MSTPTAFNNRWLLALLAAAGLAISGLYLALPVMDLEHSLLRAQELIERARTEHVVLQDPEFAHIPLSEIDDVQARKDVFIAKMLPLILRENHRFKNMRAEAQKLRPGTPAYGALAHTFGLPPAVSKTRLLRRIDQVPVSLALAQAAVESAWGTSRFALEAHAYFGERTYDPDGRGLSPDDATGFKVKSFPNPTLSVRSYMMTLNTHPAYGQFRSLRARLREQDKPLSGRVLASALGKYSETGAAYATRVRTVIRENRLEEFGAAQLEYE